MNGIKGNRTKATAIGTLVYAVLGLVLGQLSPETGGILITTALSAFGLRLAIQNGHSGTAAALLLSGTMLVALPGCQGVPITYEDAARQVDLTAEAAGVELSDEEREAAIEALRTGAGSGTPVLTTLQLVRDSALTPPAVGAVAGGLYLFLSAFRRRREDAEDNG